MPVEEMGAYVLISEPQPVLAPATDCLTFLREGAEADSPFAPVWHETRFGKPFVEQEMLSRRVQRNTERARFGGNSPHLHGSDRGALGGIPEIARAHDDVAVRRECAPGTRLWRNECYVSFGDER